MIIKILTIFLVFFIQQAKAEIIENEKIFNKTFDIWNISCEDDEMLNDIRCRLFVEITAHTTLFINPQSNENKILLISNDGYYDRKFFIKIDNNKLIESQIFANNKYGIVNFSQNDINTIYSQLMKGQNFYIRFTIKDNSSANGFKEITAKFPLAEFQKALVYFNKQINKYNFTINNN
ncbi:MAG: hypothetical protein J6C50_00175 [Rickettsiales bacterium]|nr:hypothetical protein [Rickettsiales bacterium]